MMKTIGRAVLRAALLVFLGGSVGALFMVDGKVDTAIEWFGLAWAVSALVFCVAAPLVIRELPETKRFALWVLGDDQ